MVESAYWQQNYYFNILVEEKCIIHKVIKIRKDYKMRKRRDISIKVIEANKINLKRLAEFFAKKYTKQSRKDVQK